MRARSQQLWQCTVDILFFLVLCVALCFCLLYLWYLFSCVPPATEYKQAQTVLARYNNTKFYSIGQKSRSVMLARTKVKWDNFGRLGISTHTVLPSNYNMRSHAELIVKHQKQTLDCTIYFTLVAKAQCVHVLQTLMSILPHLKLCQNSPNSPTLPYCMCQTYGADRRHLLYNS